MIKTPDQELYDAMFALSQSLGYTTVDYIPDASEITDVPNVFIGETLITPLATKDVTLGTVDVTVHVFGTRKKRQDVSIKLNTIFSEALKLKATKNYKWALVQNRSMPRVVPEKQSDGIFLWHGYVTIEMNIK